MSFQSHRWTSVLLVLCVIGICAAPAAPQVASTSARQPSLPLVVRDPGAITLLQGSIVALGGLAALRAVSAWTIDSTVTSTRDSTSHAVRYEVSGDEFRIEHKAPGASAPMVTFTSGHGRASIKGQGGATRIPPHVTHAWIVSPMIAQMLQRQLDSAHFSISDKGPSPDGTQEIIQTVNEASTLDHMVTPQTWYIDKTTLLPAKIIVHEYGPNSTRIFAQIGWTFADYRPVSGVMVPFTTARLLGDTVAETTVVNRIEFKAISDDHFAPQQ